jgi:uncharacterized protein
MRYFLICWILILLSLGSSAQVLPPPNPPRLVNDVANLLTPEQAAALERRLVALNDSTSNQIAIVSITSLNGADIESYANKLFNEWGIGTKKNNNGVLILVVAQDHKVRIEVGYGLEAAIPDDSAKSIIDRDLTPAFKLGNFYLGLDKAISNLGKAATTAYNIPIKK